MLINYWVIFLYEKSLTQVQEGSVNHTFCYITLKDKLLIFSKLNYTLEKGVFKY